MKLRSDLRSIVDTLILRSERSRRLTLDEIGEAVGARLVSHDEIDAIISELEARGRHVLSPEGGGGEDRLKNVLGAARSLRESLGRTPTVDEIATESGLSTEHVRHALALARVIQR